MEQNNEQIKLNDLDELVEFTGIKNQMKQYNPTIGHYKADAYISSLLKCRLLNCHVSSVDILYDYTW